MVSPKDILPCIPSTEVDAKYPVHVENLSPTALYPATGKVHPTFQPVCQHITVLIYHLFPHFTIAILSSSAAGATVLTYSSLSVRASLPILVISIILLGFGFFIGLAILANYTGRLLINHTPAPEKAMASFIPVAALSNAGYSASSLVSLSLCQFWRIANNSRMIQTDRFALVISVIFFPTSFRAAWQVLDEIY